MNQNLLCLVKACQRSGADYAVRHSTKYIVDLIIRDQSHLFVNCTTPLNTQSVATFFLDKDFFYTLLNEQVRMPLTIPFLDPDGDQKYQRFISHNSIKKIVGAIEAHFDYPLIIKKNKGRRGEHVFKVDSPATASDALETIFCQQSPAYDHVALAQRFIPIRNEYRAIFLDGELVFAYEKCVAPEPTTENISPLHHQGAKALQIHDPQLLAAMRDFCRPMFQRLPGLFCGIDLALDQHNEWWMIEANASPGFDYFVADQGDQAVVGLYQKIIAYLQRTAR